LGPPCPAARLSPPDRRGTGIDPVDANSIEHARLPRVGRVRPVDAKKKTGSV
jgi:hypothetical protein